MPTEVISLLSSSPAPPSPQTTQASPSVHSRAPNYGALDLTADSPRATKRPPSRISHEPIVAPKRASSGHVRQHADFMFLSDDFDTTGDLDGNVAKKARISSSSTGIERRQDHSFKRTKSAAVVSENRGPLSPVALKRWNSIADPIENSSSPNEFTTGKGPTRQNYPPDPFKSPPKKQNRNTKSSLLDLTSDPFRSSPTRDVISHRSSANPISEQIPANELLDPSKSKKSSKVPIVIDLSDGEPEESTRKSQPKKSKQNGAWDPISSSMPQVRMESSGFENLSSDDLPDLGDIDFSKLGSSRHSYSLTPSPPRKKSKAVTKGTTAKKAVEPKKTSEEKEEERKKKAEAREAERERKRVEKEQAKEQRAIEKQKEKALAEVNKLKTDRKVAVPEMIVDLPNTLNVGIKTQIEKLLGNMEVQFEYWQSHVDNVVKWRRKVNSEYNEELGHWEPVPMQIRPEKHVMVVIGAADFAKLVLGEEGHDLESHVLKMKTNFPENTLIYLIEGLMPWMRKNKNALNRRFVSAVRALDANDPTTSSNQPRRRNNAAQQEYVDEDVIEDALLSLQVVHGAIIHHTNAAVETAEWVAVFTQHISTIPYRKAREAAADAGFCMEAGQVRTGEGARDTYVRMLQEITRVTAPIAYGVAARYSTVAELVSGLELRGPLALEDCPKCANRDGALTDRTIGQAVSKRMYKIFTSRDPGSMDV